MRLSDKVIIVTGSTTGIGEAIAGRCAAEGARVTIHGRREGAGAQLVDELNADQPNRATFIEGDLQQPDVPQRIVDHTLQTFGRIDGLVNNAATTARHNLDTADADVFDFVMAVNVRAPMLLIKAAIGELKKTRGSICNIGSINAYTGEANLLPYSISKGALMTMSRNLADSLATSHVRVTHFNVGWVLTDNEYKLKIKDGLDKDWPEQVPKAFAPSGALLQPETIAAALLFWLSDESRPISGTVMELEQYPIVGRNPVKED